MTGMAETRVWLVERSYNDERMVKFVYATTDGERCLYKQLSQRMLMRKEITAALDVEDERLEPTAEQDRERFATEATRMAERHDPDDGV